MGNLKRNLMGEKGLQSPTVTSQNETLHKVFQIKQHPHSVLWMYEYLNFQLHSVCMCVCVCMCAHM